MPILPGIRAIVTAIFMLSLPKKIYVDVLAHCALVHVAAPHYCNNILFLMCNSSSKILLFHYV